MPLTYHLEIQTVGDLQVAIADLDQSKSLRFVDTTTGEAVDMSSIIDTDIENELNRKSGLLGEGEDDDLPPGQIQILFDFND